MVGRFIPILFVCSVLAAASCAGRGNHTIYTFEPKEFHSLVFTRSEYGGQLSTQPTPLAPDLFELDSGEGVWINMPKTISINVNGGEIFNWKDVIVPVCSSYWLKNDSRQRLYSEHYVYFKNIETEQIISTFVNINSYDGVQSRPPYSIPENEMDGGRATYNVIAFTELPRYSAEYEVWVQIADLESNHVRVKIDLKENGRLVMRPND